MKRQEIIQSRRMGKCFAIIVPLLISIYAYYGILYLIPNLPFLVIFTGVDNKHALIIFRTLLAAFVIILVSLMFWSYFKAKYSHPGTFYIFFYYPGTQFKHELMK